MCKKICPRCEFIKEGCEIDNDWYFYEECPECGFKYYEEDFCKDFKNCHKCGFKDNTNCEKIDEINEKEFRLSIIISLLLVTGMVIYYVMKGFK